MITPPGRMNEWFMRSPVTASKMSRISSRSRNPYSIKDTAPSSIPPVATHTRCEAIRFSSQSRTRRTCARGGASIPRSRSTDRQYASSLKNGER